MTGDKIVILVAPCQALHITPGEHLGIGYLASALRASGYIVKIIDGWLEGLDSCDISERIISSKENLLCVGFSAYASNIETVAEIVTTIRKAGVNRPLVGGGYGPTFFPEEFLGCGLDYIVSKEGDFALPMLCDHLSTGTPPISEIKNLSHCGADNILVANRQSTRPPDLDALPFPARDTIGINASLKNPTNILSSQGCTARCAYCCIHAYHKMTPGPRWRQRSIDRFLDEVQLLVEDHNVSHIKIVDDSLLEPPRGLEWCSTLADAVHARGLAGRIRFKASIRAQYVKDPIIKELKRAGFSSISCGIENFSETALKRMQKSASQKDNLNALKLLRENGIYTEAGFIWFDDMTTIRELRENCDLMIADDWMVTKTFSEMYAVRGTAFANRLLAEKKIDDDTSILGNYPYRISNEKARVVYSVLRKHWEGPYAYLYDMASNPVKSFLALSDDEYRSFHNFYIEVHKKELLLMDDLLGVLEVGGSAEDAYQLLEQYTERSFGWYEDFDLRLRAHYSFSGLRYNVVRNPFRERMPIL